jgi:hypothetical protein
MLAGRTSVVVSTASSRLLAPRVMPPFGRTRHAYSVGVSRDVPFIFLSVYFFSLLFYQQFEDVCLDTVQLPAAHVLKFALHDR